MDYVTLVNASLRAELEPQTHAVVYGQNVNAGSRLGGLAAGFAGLPNCRVLNTPNSENSLVGMGFGLMLSGVPSMYLLKQQDFLLLGVDHLVNSWNALRSRGPFVPFVLAMIVVDNGWEGPQSGFNNTGGLASLARIPAFFATGELEIPLAVSGAFQGGPAILAVSQRLFRTEMKPLELASEASSHDSYVVYTARSGVSSAPLLVILASNFSLDYAVTLRKHALDRGCDVTVISYFKYEESVDDRLAAICAQADFVVSIDDRKATLGADGGVCADLRRRVPSAPITSLSRRDTEDWALPRQDVLDVDPESVLKALRSSGRR